MFYSKYYKIFAPIVLVLAIAICYGHTLSYPFLWDDEVIIVNNPAIKRNDAIGHIFSTTLFGEKAVKGTFYRPLHVLSYVIDYKIFKLNPLGYHITNILLHIGVTLLIWFLLLLLGIKEKLAFLVSLIFAVHPINTETVVYISDRGDLLFSFFSLLCILFFVKGESVIARRRSPKTHVIERKCPSFVIERSEATRQQSQRKRLTLPERLPRRLRLLAMTRVFGFRLLAMTPLFFNIFSIIMFLAALFSKETAVVVPFILLAYVIFLAQNKKRSILPLGILLTSSIVYSLMQISYRLSRTSETLSLIAKASFYERLLTLPRILFTYIKLLIFPHNLHMEYLFVERNLTSFNVWFSALFVIAFIFVIIKYTKSLKKVVFFLLWFFIGLVPFYNILITLPATLREHWVYFPCIGFLVGISLFINQCKFRKICSISLGIVLLYFTGYTIMRA